VPAGTTQSTLVAPYNDASALEEVFESRGDEIAAVIVEPIAGNMGVVVADANFIRAIRDLTDRHGALYIADEVISGFRVNQGGAQALTGILPDLTTLGKIIGGGLPVGAYGGPRRIMERMAPTGPVYQAGTLAGNPLAMAAGIESLRPLREPTFYDRLAELTDSLRDALESAARAEGVPVCINAVTGMLTLFFAPGPVTTLTEAQGSDTRLYARFFHAMLDRGFYLPPSQFEAWMLSAAHSDDDVRRTAEAAHAAFRELAAA
jgi:glutamate-1-semialdehyde 2,1-aminomutase